MFTTLHSFSGDDGAGSHAALVQGSDGNFYGTTPYGGSNDDGTIFSVTPAGVFTTLYTFSGEDGANPIPGLVQGSDGNFYGTTEDENSNYFGTVFSITPAGVHTLLYSFAYGMDGFYPSGLVQGGDGNFYGTTADGPNNGTVFKLTIGATTVQSAFFVGQTALERGSYYLAFPDGNYFGYYSFLTDPHFIYHLDLGYEYIFDAADGDAGRLLLRLCQQHLFLYEPDFSFPVSLRLQPEFGRLLYPDPNNPGRYNTGGVRYFYDFATDTIISK